MEEFARDVRVVFLEEERQEGRIRVLFLDRLRQMAGMAVNEILEYWVKGLADGNGGHFPELCVELPYLERDGDVEPLTLAYCVDNEDDTRTELHQIPLLRVIERILDSPRQVSAVRLEAVARELRLLARTLELHLNEPHV
jgi:hypothetical protein